MDGIDTFSQLVTQVQSDLVIGTESTLNTETAVKSAINRSRLKAESLFRWPALNDAKKTSTIADHEYYDAPENWRPQSLWKLTVGGESYGEEPDGSPMNFQDFLNWQEENPGATDKKWAVQWLRYFIAPIPDSDGNNDIVVWGQKNGDWLTENEDTTIFSYSLPECNEAIILEAKAMLRQKGTEVTQTGQFFSLEAKALLTAAWTKIKQEQLKQEVARPMFEVPDLYKGRNTTKKNTNIGNF